jgi:hypothetical protein
MRAVRVVVFEVYLDWQTWMTDPWIHNKDPQRALQFSVSNK